jgi:cytochrome P450 family 142 subfamily A polypeptide 1
MYDIADLELSHEDRGPLLEELRSHPGLAWDAKNDLWLVARHADVAAASHATDVFSSAGGVTYFESMPLSFVTMDEPEHGRLRRIVSRQFTPKMVRGLREQTRQYTQDCLDGVDSPDSVDFVAAVAGPVTLRVIADMLGLPPADLPMVKAWTDAMMDAGGRLDEPGVLESATESFGAWTAYVDAQVDIRLQEAGDDLLSRLAHADDENLDREELAMFATTLMVAGNETTRHTSSRGIEVLGQHPDQQRRLVESLESMPVAVEEILRWTSVTRAMMRTVTADVTFAGSELSQGDRVVLVYPSANRDADVFDSPDEFRIDRDPNPHLSFGIGTHFCIGANLARMELQEILGVVLARHPQIRQVPGTTAVHRANGLVAGVAEMPVDLTGTAG